MRTGSGGPVLRVDRGQDTCYAETMQTFLPYPDFAESARVLDRQRLGKQRVENLQIMKALVTEEGWVNHPATKMWVGYEHALLLYQTAICDEWVRIRGYKDTCYEKTLLLLFDKGYGITYEMPKWLGDETFHLSHQSNLLRKNPEWYGQFFQGVPDNLEYVWPVR